MDSPVAQSSTAARRFRSALTVLARRLARTPWGAEVFSFTTWSTWEYQAAIAVYSAGEGATFAYLEAARAELVRMGLWDSFRSRPKDQRWSLLANAVWGIPNRRGQTQTNAWVMIRPRERLECARELAATREDGATLLWSRGDPRWPEEFDREVSAVAFGGDPVR